MYTITLILMNDLEGGLKMGSRGAFLDKGFSVQKWKAVGYTSEGIKILEPIDKKKSRSLPERSNTPETTYVLYRKNGDFDQIRKFNKNRIPKYDIDYGIHNGIKFLHVHYYKDGIRSKKPVELKQGDKLYEKYKLAFKE